MHNWTCKICGASGTSKTPDAAASKLFRHRLTEHPEAIQFKEKTPGLCADCKHNTGKKVCMLGNVVGDSVRPCMVAL